MSYNNYDKIYHYIIDNDLIMEDYFPTEKEEQTLEKLFHTFMNESVLTDSIKIKMLKKIEDKKTVYEYFNLVQTKFNVMFYGMK